MTAGEMHAAVNLGKVGRVGGGVPLVVAGHPFGDSYRERQTGSSQSCLYKARECLLISISSGYRSNLPKYILIMFCELTKRSE